jgi:galactose mutarotase-like enzyme
MALYHLNNSKLGISIDTFGAELKSLKNLENGKEYLWDGKPEYWKRTSPVLFPIVGSLRGGRYLYEGREYPMSQHGFARDMEFAFVSKTENEIRFSLTATDETKAKYPFDFKLEIGYRLEKNNVIVSWKVVNSGDKEMYFSIGAHPAFLCPLNEGERQSDYSILFDTNETVTSSVIGEGGTLSSRQKTYTLEQGYLNIAPNLFDEDALVIENNQAHKISLCTADRKPYVTVSFDAPLFGLWSPTKKNAPFVCIEPWYGRCDRDSFQGKLSQREWGNQLAPGEQFVTEYTITI